MLPRVVVCSTPGRNPFHASFSLTKITMARMNFDPKYWTFLVLLPILTLALVEPALTTSSKHSADINTLQLVQVVFRHGDRTPFANAFPNDPYGDSSYWPEGFGQLTKQGIMRQYQLGQYLRFRYAGFLNKTYNREEVFVRSSDLDRTIMSAQANLAGLYPPEDKRDRWNKHLLWQPIPVHSIHVSIDNKINFARSCPKYKLLLQELLDSIQLRELNEKHKDLYEYLTKYSGRNVLEFNAVAEIYDTLFVQELHGLKLPKWANEVYPHKMVDLAVLPFELISSSAELSKLRAGPLLHDIVHNIDVHLNKTFLTGVESLNFRKAKFHMNSGHDTTVTTLMNALGIYDKKHIPGYASILIVELHRSADEKPFVKVLYRNNTDDPPTEMQIQGCQPLPAHCCYRKFKDLVASKTLNDTQWERECSIPVPGIAEISNQLINAMNNASDKDKLLRKLRSVGRELYEGYLKFLVFWFKETQGN